MSLVCWVPLTSPPADLRSAILERMTRVFEEWRDTPFVPGQCVKQIGADCIHFMGGFLDEMYRFERAHLLPRPRQDTAIHAPDESAELLKQIQLVYPEHQRLTSNKLEPGDVAVTGPRAGGEGHVLIAGTRRNEFWHAQGSRVKVSGPVVISRVYDKVFGYFHMLEKHRWA